VNNIAPTAHDEPILAAAICACVIAQRSLRLTDTEIEEQSPGLKRCILLSIWYEGYQWIGFDMVTEARKDAVMKTVAILSGHAYPDFDTAAAGLITTLSDPKVCPTVAEAMRHESLPLVRLRAVRDRLVSNIPLGAEFCTAASNRYLRYTFGAVNGFEHMKLHWEHWHQQTAHMLEEQS